MVLVAILAVPTIFVVVASFGDSREIAFPPQSFTLHWYSHVIGDSQSGATLSHSLVAAVVAALVSAVAGVPAAIGLNRLGGRIRVALALVLSAGLSAPPIIAAFGFYDVFSRLNTGGLLLLGVALGIVNFPFMLWAVSSALEDEPELIPAAATLGADPVEQFLFVRLPLIMPGVMTGTLLVFVLSLTDFVVSQVLTNVGDQTLAVFVYSSLRATISPALGASSAVFIVIAAAAFFLVLRFGRMERSCSGADDRGRQDSRGRPSRHGLHGPSPRPRLPTLVAMAEPLPGPVILQAVAGRDPRRTEVFAERFEIAHAFTDWRALIQDPAVTVFDNVGPNHLHAEPALAALAAGKHVVCEKPLALNGEQAWELTWPRAKPGSSTCARSITGSSPRSSSPGVIGEGRLGEIRHFRARTFRTGWSIRRQR